MASRHIRLIIASSSMRLVSVKSHTVASNIVTGYIEKMKEDTRTEIAETLSQRKRFSIVTDEWTSIRNRRYLSHATQTHFLRK
jgi:hypothetical protein